MHNLTWVTSQQFSYEGASVLKQVFSVCQAESSTGTRKPEASWKRGWRDSDYSQIQSGISIGRDWAFGGRIQFPGQRRARRILKHPVNRTGIRFLSPKSSFFFLSETQNFQSVRGFGRNTTERLSDVGVIVVISTTTFLFPRVPTLNTPPPLPHSSSLSECLLSLLCLPALLVASVSCSSLSTLCYHGEWTPSWLLISWLTFLAALWAHGRPLPCSPRPPSRCDLAYQSSATQFFSIFQYYFVYSRSVFLRQD